MYSNTFGRDFQLAIEIQKTLGAQLFSNIAIMVGIAFSRVVRIVPGVHWDVLDQHLAPSRGSARQYFLKQDAVFSNVLVYSGCSASRFPSARSN
jgi:hypothetical protein